MANSVDPDQTAPIGAYRSSLFWVHAVCFYTYIVSNVRQLFAADDFSRPHFQMHFFLGVLRVKPGLVEVISKICICFLIPYSCPDPESFVREGVQLRQHFFFFFFIWWGEGGSKYYHKRGHHRPTSETPFNGVSLACRWWSIIECWLGGFVIFQGFGPVLLRNPIFLWFFKGGGGGRGPDTLFPLLEPCMLLPFSTLHYSFHYIYQCYCFFDFIIYVPVNNCSAMSGRL